MDARIRQRAIVRVLWIEMSLNLLVAGAKAAYGFVSGSLAVSSDALHSLVDASGNVIALIVMRVAGAPPDKGHPYGHQKAEIVASLVVGVAVAAVGVRFAWSAIGALLHGRETPSTSAAGFMIVAGTWVVNVLVTIWEARRARELQSPLLLADAAHTGSDVAVTATVMGALVGSHFGWTWADPVGTLLVVAVIGRVAYGIIGNNLGILLDRVAVDAEQVRQIAMENPAVRHCHRIRSRGPQGAVHLDLHLWLDGDTSLRAAHDVAHAVEAEIKHRLPDVLDVVIHTEPAGLGEHRP